MDDINISIQPDIQVVLNSQVEIQGDVILDLISIKENFAKYRLPVFNNPEYIICDYRTQSLTAIKTCKKNGQFDGFIENFNRPARLCIKKYDSKSILVELQNSVETNPNYMMWIAIGINEKTIIPDYSFIVKQEACLKDKKALLSIYVRPLKGLTREVALLLSEIIMSKSYNE